MTTRQRIPASLAFLATIALALGGCGGGNDDSGTQAVDTGPQPVDAGPRPVGEPGLETLVIQARQIPGAPMHIAQLADVRSASHDRTDEHPAFDRVVLEFEQGARMPEQRVGYVQPPIREDGSGDEVELAGAAFLELRLSPASGADLSGDELRITYDGPTRIEIDGHVATELVRTGDFEATLTWVLGLDERVPFAFEFLDNPPRLVVDVVAEESP